MSNILAVDDEPGMEALLGLAFRKEIKAGEIQLLCAHNGQDALRILQRHSDIRVVLSDIGMPGMDGIALLARLRTDFPLICPIMMSADGNLQTLRAVMNQGAYDFLLKPLDLKDVKITVAKAIRQATANYHQVSERQRAEAARHQSARQYRVLLEQIGDGVAVFQENRLVFWNPALCAMLDTSSEQLVQMKLFTMLGIPQLPRDSSDNRQTWQAHHTTLTGRKRWLENWQCAIQWEGEPALLVTVRDVTDYKLHELHLLQEDERLRKENSALKTTLARQRPFSNLVGESAAMQEVQKSILVAAATDLVVMLSGETGTGKELAARLIHQLSARSQKPFIPVNCAEISDSLFEREFFGHQKGAFTGASADRPGLLAEAHQGTLFVDEVAELSLDEQVKLLRVLEYGTYRPVGSSAAKQADVRLITATNRDLTEMVNTGRFREDLFFRLHAIEIVMPPLRERKEDLPELITHFLKQQGKNQTLRMIPKHHLQQLYAHHWPGNVRELQHVLNRYLVTHELSFANIRTRQTSLAVNSPQTAEKPLDQTVANLEKRMILQALEQHHWHRAKAAAQLGIPIRTFRRKIKQYQILEPYQRRPSQQSNA